MNDRKIILASQSPRRKWLLKEMGFEFEVKTKDIDESFPSDLEVGKVAEFIAQKKADGFKDELTTDNLIITADTVVIHDGVILGKPSTFAEAKEMINRLSDDTHTVVTGVCVNSMDKSISFSDSSEVHIAAITEQEMDYYIENFSPLDKAGAYGIQEWFGHNLVKKIVGSYTNIMGLPTAKLYAELTKF